MITPARSILLDAEALTALARKDSCIQPYLNAVRKLDAELYASAATLAEVTDGSNRDIAVRRAMTALRVVQVDETVGYRAGALRAQAKRSRKKIRDLTLDAIVAATALALPSRVIVLTSDVPDLTLLLDGTGVLVEQI